MTVIAFPRRKVVGINSMKSKHLKALRFIEAYRTQNGGRWPSFVQVQEALGLGSKLGAVRIVNHLFQLDAIARPLPNQGSEE